MKMRMSITRSIANGVPPKRMTGGKNSPMEGPWNPPSSLAAALAIRDATWVSSGGSGFGAPAKAGATIGHERQPAGHSTAEADSRTGLGDLSTLSRNRVRHEPPESLPE
jgi:hypothetical protein